MKTKMVEKVLRNLLLKQNITIERKIFPSEMAFKQILANSMIYFMFCLSQKTQRKTFQNIPLHKNNPL